MASSQARDSLHVSLDGVHQAAVGGFGRDWSWSKIDLSGGDAQLTLDGGLHELALQMREDRVRVDAVMASDDPAFVPSGAVASSSPTGTITSTANLLNSHVVTYLYDDLYRLTEATYVGDLNASYSYQYDFVGNMAAYTETVDSTTKVVTRTFNANNQLTHETTDGTLHKDFYYDDNGNLVQENALTTAVPVKLYDFNQRNLMIRYSESISQTLTKATFIYDGNNDRVAQGSWENGTQTSETRYTNDTLGLTQVLVSDDGATQVYNLLGLDLIGQQAVGSNQFRVLLGDSLGSVRTEMDGNTILAVQSYSPFGEVIQTFGEAISDYSWTGEQRDEETGFIYLRARYFNPTLKTFMGRDPHKGYMNHPMSYNLYLYASANPINRLDPTGMTDGGSWWDSAKNAIQGVQEYVLENKSEIAAVATGVALVAGAAVLCVGTAGIGCAAVAVGAAAYVGTAGYNTHQGNEWHDNVACNAVAATAATATALYTAPTALGWGISVGSQAANVASYYGASTTVALGIEATVGYGLGTAYTAGMSAFVGGATCAGYDAGCQTVATAGAALAPTAYGAGAAINHIGAFYPQKFYNGAQFVGYHGASSVHDASIRKGIRADVGTANNNFGGRSQLGPGFYTSPQQEGGQSFAGNAAAHHGGRPVVYPVYARNYSSMQGASVPRPLWWKVAPNSPYITNHDYLTAPVDGLEHWDQIKFNPDVCDQLFVR